MSSLLETISTSASHECTPGFSRQVRIEEFDQIPGVSASERGRLICRQLEIGNLLLLPKTPFVISQEDRELLLGRKQVSSPYHKNIAYRPSEDRVTGLDASEREDAPQLRRILRNYSQQASQFMNAVLTPYANQWKLDYTSFRPIEEKGRLARVHTRNDLLHFDSFPTRPTNGGRILRLFTNINPVQNRVWLTSQTFEALGPQFAKAVGLQSAPKGNFIASLIHLLPGVLKLSMANRPPYDEYMHRCHNAMKEDANFQVNTPKHRWEFPPNCSWLAFTDCVSHAVLEGQYALEQTFIISPTALVARDRSPLAILERVAGHSLVI